MANILFVHNNFPAQFGHLGEALPERGHLCRAISSPTGRPLPDVPVSRWVLGRGTTQGIFSPATRAEADLLRGEAAARVALRLKADGFSPDLVIGHPGWGETLFLREVFPRARQILYGEFYYHGSGGDVGFDPEFGEPDFDERVRVYAKNATGALAYAAADRIVSPTAFQAGLLPNVFRARQVVLHEGIDTEAISPGPAGRIRLSDGTMLDGTMPVVTFANRRFEPMRGVHTFMRALPALQARVPEARIVMIGADEPGGYGASAGEGTTWKARLLSELEGRLDLSRIHFTGTLPHAHLHAVMRLSAAHVYLTYPFALSWSLLEAMSLGCLVVGSATAPVQEVIRHGENGLLVDMLDPAAIAETLVDACTGPRERFAPLRIAARGTALQRYDRERVCLPAWLDLVDEVLAG
ncbi:glycosyltransferase [uncultured Enterovirga sp.]|uniref:glycosyltransferase n=1 Tax=uncultured Enterovirga sp. TaxID=2026352 RepID=UPI0035CB134F